MNTRHASAILLLLVATAGSQAAPLGRLFFTPEQRTILDRQRQANFRSIGAGRSAPAELTVSGIIERQSGGQTAWINGVPSDGSVALPGIRVVPIPGAPGNLRIEGETKNPTVKVGDTYRLGTGERADTLQGGTIVVQALGAGRGTK